MPLSQDMEEKSIRTAIASLARNIRHAGGTCA
jgi:hypothetical protein